MPRFITACVTAAVAAAALVMAAPAQAGYYVIRWDNTGICQLWSEAFGFKPIAWPSGYKVVSRTMPSLNDAIAMQVQLRLQGRCTL